MESYSPRQLMLILAYGAYCQFWENKPEELYDGIDTFLKKSEVNKTLVWGPAVSKGLAFTNALMYIVQDNIDENDYTIVIRGTNPFSITTWIFQDVDVESQVPWNMVITSNTVSDDVKISKAAANSIIIHYTLKPEPGLPGEGKNFTEFLERIISGKGKKENISGILKQLTSRKRITLNFTGHSLGGLLSSTLALWLHDSYPQWKDKMNLHVHSFAALTAGNKSFAAHSDSILSPNCHRYYNYLDLAVHAWNSESLLRFTNAFRTQFTWHWKSKKALIRVSEKIAPLEYTQVSKGINIPATHFFKWNYIAEVLYQHAAVYPFSILQGKKALKLLVDLLISSFLLVPGGISRRMKRKFRNLIKKLHDNIPLHIGPGTNHTHTNHSNQLSG